MLLLLTTDQCYSETYIVAAFRLFLPETFVRFKFVHDSVIQVLS